MGKEECCPQCRGLLSSATNRLVQDACGHKKCRLCLVNDVNSCQQCLQSQLKHETTPLNFHTTVITYQSKSVDSVETKQEPNEVLAEEKKSDVNFLPSHVEFHRESLEYTCTICKRSFTAKSQIQYHVYCNGTKKPFECDHCKKGFIVKSHFQSHMLVHQNVKPFTCNVCNKNFFERSKLNRHKLIHTQNRSFVCQQCGKAFKIKENLRTHLLIHKTDKPYECKDCGAKFSHASNLKKHSSIHTVVKSHMCDQCGKQFKLKWALTVHRRTHLKVRPNKCATCAKTFVHLKDLHRHELIHVDSKEFTCGICGTKFKRKDNLNRHTKNTHPGKKPQVIKDTPNAIKVITAPAVSNAKSVDEGNNEVKTEHQVNVPIKLAFKTSSFKSHYNIQRDYVEPPVDPVNINIYEKILLPSSPSTKQQQQQQVTPHNSSTDIARKLEEESNLICQKILGPFNAPAHYETSFDNKKHAVIKNIKFKLPAKYMTQEAGSSSSGEMEKREQQPMSATASVIVNNENNNNNASNTDVHWRRRTLQNLNTKEN